MTEEEKFNAVDEIRYTTQLLTGMDGHNNQVQVVAMVCGKCTAVIWDQRQHDIFHNQLGH